MKSGYLQITRKCNNECIFCSNPQFEKELTIKEAKKKIDDFKDIKTVIITGGEPTIYPYLSNIIKYILEKGYEPKIISNGVKLCNKLFVRELFDCGLRNIHILTSTGSAFMAFP